MPVARAAVIGILCHHIVVIACVILLHTSFFELIIETEILHVDEAKIAHRLAEPHLAAVNRHGFNVFFAFPLGYQFIVSLWNNLLHHLHSLLGRYGKVETQAVDNLS